MFNENSNRHLTLALPARCHNNVNHQSEKSFFTGTLKSVLTEGSWYDV